MVVLILSINPLNKSLCGFVIGGSSLVDLIDERHRRQGHRYDKSDVNREVDDVGSSI